MKVITKKIWPEFFRQVKAGRNKFELRLADFRVGKGDVLMLREWDPKKKKYTRHTLPRKVKAVHRVDVTKFYSLEELKRYGLYVIEL